MTFFEFGLLCLGAAFVIPTALALSFLAWALYAFFIQKPEREELTLERMLADVRDFHLKFGHPVDEISELPEKNRLLRAGLLSEECTELNAEVRTPGDHRRSHILEESIDVMYVTLGALVERGINPVEGWKAKHAYNMTKIACPDGGKASKNPKVPKPDYRTLLGE